MALYGRAGRWALTERRGAALARGAHHLAIGPSTLAWGGEGLTVEIAEVTAPLPSRLRGRVRLWPEAAPGGRGFVLDAAGRHRWRPIAAAARVEVEMRRPALRWSGPAYFDANSGDAPLEEDFPRRDWCRAPLRRGSGAAVLYNVMRRDGSARPLALRIHPSGRVEEVEPPPPARLPRTLWRMERPTRADAGHAPRVVRTLQDAPFYARSVVATHLLGEPVVAMHENLDRFRAPWVQAMLPFRIPRALR